jgi:uncharacterized protein
MLPRFEWDDAKDRRNQRSHGLSFADASRLFESVDRYLEIFDLEHSDVEDRFIGVGAIDRGIVVVVYVETDDGAIRIISARFATARERSLYWAHMGQRR